MNLHVSPEFLWHVAGVNHFPQVNVCALVRREQPDWEPSCIIVDACAAEIAAIQMEFPSAVCTFICHWHAQSAWKKQLYQKVGLG